MNLPIKYRPIEFGQVVGQSVAVEIAKASLMQTELQTTFLLVGASGSGKTTLARIMARAIDCEERLGVEPCNQCDSCLSHLQDRHLAITEMNGADKNGVDDVREIIERCQLNVIGSKYRVLIVDECHQMSKSAQNAMLKLLEDPPTDTIFLLCTTEEDKLLETIRSRARILRFQTVGRDLVTGYLLNIAHHEQIPLTEPEANRIYEYNKGSIRQCLQTLGTLNERVTVEDLCPRVGETEIKELILAFDFKDYFNINNILQKIVDRGFYPKAILLALIDYTVEMMTKDDTGRNLASNIDRVLNVVIPAAGKLGTGKDAIVSCRLALYEAATVWQPLDQNSSTQPLVEVQTQLSPQSQSLPETQSQVDYRSGKVPSNNYQYVTPAPTNYGRVDRVTDRRLAVESVRQNKVQSVPYVVGTGDMPVEPNSATMPPQPVEPVYRMPMNHQPYSRYAP